MKSLHILLLGAIILIGSLIMTTFCINWYIIILTAIVGAIVLIYGVTKLARED